MLWKELREGPGEADGIAEGDVVRSVVENYVFVIMFPGRVCYLSVFEMDAFALWNVVVDHC